ncbi:MAG TPA: condensation domain-containing protein, partial [Blastocatellia bacterium]
MIQLASLSFDASVLEIFSALLGGAALHLVSRDIVASGTDLSLFLSGQSITAMAIPPSLLDQIPARDYPALQTIIVGGEACGADTAERWSRGRKLYNAYAPTEATIYATLMECAEGLREAPPVGRPIDNVQVYLLDEHMQPVPVAVAGEIYVGGEAIARGYLNRADLTAERFLPDPYTQQRGSRLYRTGDLGRHRADGGIEFVGRADEQVKVRGYRIEPGEIEAVVGSHTGVREAVVVARGEGGEKRLVCYVVKREEGEEVGGGELREYVKRKLPDYMMPSAFVFLDRFPLGPTGKVDRSHLPPPEAIRPELSRVYLAPRTPLEEVLAGMWSDLLGIERVGVDDDFFELGGHSLLATQAVSRIRQAFGVEMPLRTLFERPTIAETARQVNEAIRTRQALESPPIARASRDQHLPLSFAQQRLWFLDQFEPGSPLYNIHVSVRIEGKLDVAALESSINEVIRRHEILRTTFSMPAEQLAQVIHEESNCALTVVDLSQEDESEQEAERLSALEAQRPFDLMRGPLLRIILLRLGEQNYRLLLTMHHIISDGWSMGVFMREVAALYEAHSKGKALRLAELPIQYADFARWQRDWLDGKALERQIDYWRRHLAESPPVLKLPIDRPRPPVQTYAGAHEPFRVNAIVSNALKNLGRSEGATLFMTLLAAFDVLLYRYSGQRDILVGTPIANRNRQELEPLIGFFVNTLVMRVKVESEATFREVIRRAKESAMGGYEHQEVAFEKVVEELRPERDLSHTPIFQVMLDLHNAPMPALELPELRLTPLEVEVKMAKFDLTLTATETEEGLAGSLEYNTDLFGQETIKRMLEHFKNLIDDAVARPGESISRLALLSQAETEQLLFTWNDTHVDHPTEPMIHELFEQQVEQTPEAVAVICGDECLCYRELNERANKLAHRLHRLGVGPESRVGICIERSPEMVVGVMGILKAGGAYVPLDPAYPNERLRYLSADAGIEVVVTQEHLLDQVGASASAICLDRDWRDLDGEASYNPDRRVSHGNAAYVIYTSGSTGSPKGVVVSHHNLIHSTQARLHYYKDAITAFLLLSSISFDSSVVGLFWTLCTGGALVIPEEGAQRDPALLIELITRREVSHLLCLPSLYAILLKQGSPQQFATLRAVIVAGEACPGEVADQHNEIVSRATLFNEYGPTEVTVWASAHDCRHHESGTYVPIGRPIANTQIY